MKSRIKIFKIDKNISESRKLFSESRNILSRDGKTQQKTVTEKKEVKTLPLDSYKHFKREERAGRLKPSKSSTLTSTMKKRTTHT